MSHCLRVQCWFASHPNLVTSKTSRSLANADLLSLTLAVENGGSDCMHANNVAAGGTKKQTWVRLRHPVMSGRRRSLTYAQVISIATALFVLVLLTGGLSKAPPSLKSVSPEAPDNNVVSSKQLPLLNLVQSFKPVNPFFLFLVDPFAPQALNSQLAGGLIA